MGLTNFPRGVSSFGTPIFGGNMSVPIMGSSGKAIFVDPARGSDGNRGTWERPLATVTKAYSLTTDKAGDVVYLLNDGNTSGTSRDTATITWANDNTHLVGLCAPSLMSQRARISPPTSASAIVTPMLKVTGHGNVFANLSFFEGTSQDSTASVGVEIELGTRNYFYNVAIMNLGDATNGHSGDETGSAHLLIDGGQENVFENCYIGLDTAPRSDANANVRFTKNGSTAATRNVFRGCVFPAFADNAGVLFIQASESGGTDRYQLFENCTFVNATNSSATAMTAAIAHHASTGGHIIIKDSMLIGATDWTATDSTVVQLLCHQWDTTNDVNIGIASPVDVS